VNTFPLVIEPVALKLGPISVTWYGMILGLGAVVGLLLAIREGKRFQIAPEFFMDLLLIGAPCAIIGARTYYVAFEWEHYKGDWYEIIAVWHGGLAIHGALIGAMAAGLIYTRVKKASFWRIADIAAPSLIAGQMIGRWGNFVNQEAHGGPVSREFLSDTLHLPDWIVNQMQIGDTFYHPTFLYESLWNLMVLLVLLWLRRRPWLKAGELFLGYFALYSLGRFFIEGLRTDSLAFHGPYWLENVLAVLWLPMRLLFDAGELPPGGGNVRMAQFISLMLILTAVILIAVRRFGGFARERYLDPIVIGTAAGAGAGGAAEAAGATGGQAGASTAADADGSDETGGQAKAAAAESGVRGEADGQGANDEGKAEDESDGEAGAANRQGAERQGESDGRNDGVEDKTDKNGDGPSS
jgi:phosphatidylglycerol:prolipoprotein diacylglycerol transferase